MLIHRPHAEASTCQLRPAHKPNDLPSPGVVSAGPYDARANLLAAVQGELMRSGSALDVDISPKEQLLQFLQPYVAYWQRLTQTAAQ